LIIYIISIIFITFNITLCSGQEDHSESATGLMVTFGGDVMLGNWIIDITEQKGFEYSFKNIKKYFSNADISFCNLESPFTDAGIPYEKEYVFKVPPGYSQILKLAGIDVVSLANNHMMDYGEEGLLNTINTLKEYGIYYCGAGINKKEASEPVILEKEGVKLGFLSYSMTFPQEFWAAVDTPGTAYPYEEEMVSAVEELEKDVDISIVSFHWGAEKSNHPKEYQVEFAHKAIDSGADIIVGHHPHVVQGVEVYKKKIIFYSLGNLIFGSYSPYAKTGAIAKVTIDADFVRKAVMIPIRIFNKEVSFQPQLLETEEKKEFFRWLSDISRELNRNINVINIDGVINLDK